MSSYAYYRERPGWGTQQFQFAPPPVPAFRPEPTWGGRDYYSAAAMSPDLGVFDTAYNRIRAGGSSYNGVGFHDARSAHRRAYGGLGELNMMLPNELGAAAGYEAYRNWVHNSSVYEPTRFDDERQREALIGLAMAEATRLWNSAGRRLDRYGMQEACEAAAATVTVIMDQWRDPYAMTSSIPYSNTSSPYSSSVSVGSTDPYADDEIAFRRAHSPSRRHHHHHHHHRRRSSTNMAPGLVSGGAGAVPIPMPGTHQSPYGAPMPLSGTGMSPNTYGGMPVSVSVSPYGATIAQPQLVNTVPQMVYNTQPQPQPQPQPAQVFPAPMPQSSTIILQPTSSSRHRHGHHHKHRSRSRTRDSGHDHHHHRSRRYSDAATYYYGQPSTGTSGLIAAPRVMNTGGSMGMPVTYGPPVVAPSYTTAYRY